MKKIAYLATIITVVTTMAHGILTQPSFATLPSTWPHQSSDLKPDQQVVYGELENGLRYAIRPNTTPAEQASIRLLIDVGSKHEYDDEQGIAHFIEHMAFNGSKNVPEGELVKLLERHGLAFGADANAYTSYNHTVYQLDLPNLKPDVVDTAFLLMRETAGNILFDAEAIERERGVVLAEKRRENIHAKRSSDARLSFIYPGTRMLDRRPIGTEKGISSFTKEKLVAFYRAFYRPDNAFLVVVGDIDPVQFQTRIEQSFASWTAIGAPRTLHYSNDPAEFIVETPKAKHFVNPQDRTSISISVDRPFEKTADNRAHRIDGLFEYAGNSILTQRLQNLRMDGKADYLGAGANSSVFNKVAYSAYLGLFLEEDQWQSGMQDAVIELNKALRHGFTLAEVEELLANLRTSFKYSVSSADNRQSSALADSILSSFAADTVYTTPQTDLELFKLFEEQVTPRQISKEFVDQWAHSAPKIFFISKQEFPDAAEELINTFNEAMAVAVAAPEAIENAEFAYTEFGQTGTVVDKSHLADIDAYTVRFSNNVMLNLKKTDLQKDTLHLSLRFGGGTLSAPKEQPGLLTLLSSTFTGGGTEAHTATELRKILAGRTVSANMGTTNDSFVLQAAVTPKDLLLQLQLWSAYLTDPAYREEPISLYKQSVEALYHALENTPGQVARYQVGKILYGGDPRFFLPPKASIQELAAPDLRTFFSDQLQNSAMEISIVGDLDVEKTIEFVAQTLGALAERERVPAPYMAARQVHFPAPGQKTLYHKGEKDQGILQLYWPTTDYSDIKLSAQLDLLRSILSDRVREAVREDLGASYAPGVSNLESDVFPGYGYLAFSVDAKPEDMELITSIVHEEIGSLIDRGISDDDLERARRPMLEGIENAVKHNGHWLNRISQAQTKPESVNDAPSIASTWRSTNTSQLIELATRYLKPSRALEIRIIPYPQDL